MTNRGSPAENGCVGVDDDAILDGRMSLGTTDQLAIRIGCEAQCAQRHPLIDFNMIADVASFADHHSRSVINKKRFTDCRAWMNIDSGLLVCPFGHHARDKWNGEMNQLMRDTINRNGF